MRLKLTWTGTVNSTELSYDAEAVGAGGASRGAAVALDGILDVAGGRRDGEEDAGQEIHCE